MLHLLEVNTLNFCSFAACAGSAPSPSSPAPGLDASPEDILVAVPNTLLAEAVRTVSAPRPGTPGL